MRDTCSELTTTSYTFKYIYKKKGSEWGNRPFLGSFGVRFYNLFQRKLCFLAPWGGQGRYSLSLAAATAKEYFILFYFIFL